MLEGRLYIVAGPLGNDADLSPRARDILASADLVLAEDTRRAGLLFKRLGIPSHGFTSFFDHNEAERVPQVLAALARGETVALVSDAGTPLISDPGYRLVRACREAGHPVSPLPGPSAVTAALSACGLPPMPFAFLGFLPRKAGQAKKVLAPFAALEMTLVIFERKDRVAGALALALEALGDREACIARELTKDHEEFILDRLSVLTGGELDLKGEVTLVIGPPPDSGGEGERSGEDEVRRLAEKERALGGKPRQVARRVAKGVNGWTADQVYDLLAKP